jgi:hypothetical protein
MPPKKATTAAPKKAAAASANHGSYIGMSRLFLNTTLSPRSRVGSIVIADIC